MATVGTDIITTKAAGGALECGEDRRFGTFFEGYHPVQGATRSPKERSKAAILAALQSAPAPV
jgi:hypothetical protein